MSDDRCPKSVAEGLANLHKLIHGEEFVGNEEEVIEFYKNHAPIYEDMIRSGNMVRNQIICKILGEYYPDKAKRSELKVLDLAAGTGLIGDSLYEVGFTHIDGVDLCDEMLKELASKPTYKKSWKAYLGEADKGIEGVEDGSYDIVVMSGGFAHSHLSINVIGQAARALRTGGLFVNSMKELYITSVPQLHGLEPLMRQMEEEKIWKWTLRLVDENEWPGLYHACRKI